MNPCIMLVQAVQATEAAKSSPIIDFFRSIGWEEMGVIATFLAVVVALRANHVASKQLTAALKMQEQSKNVALLEQRVKVADTIRQDEVVSETTLRILFNDAICESYAELQRLIQEKSSAEHDMQEYLDVCSEDGAFGPENSVKAKIEEYEMYLERDDCPQEIVDGFKKFCDEHPAWFSVTGFSDDRRMYNYADIRKRYSDAAVSIINEKEKIMKLIEGSIKESIAPVKE